MDTCSVTNANISFFTGNGRIRASAVDVLKAYESWSPYEVVGATRIDTNPAPSFYRLRHIAVLSFETTISTGSLAPEYIFIRLPSVIVPILADRVQATNVVCSRHGKDIPSERWIVQGTATVDPTGGGENAHYMRIECRTGFLIDQMYDIHGQVTLELI